jgi:3-oxoacyl-[acyl-carrier protein] reductase
MTKTTNPSAETESNQISTDQKIAMITGSSSGIGLAIATGLAKQNWFVILHGRTHSEKLRRAQHQIESMGGRTAALAADFCSQESLEPFVQAAWQVAGRIDAWINNAGGDVLTGSWPHRSLSEKMDYLLKVDVASTLLLSRLVGKRMQTAAGTAAATAAELEHESGRFSILNMGWDQAFQGMAGESGELFAATKGAVMAMTLSLAQSLGPQVRVNCLAPGWIRTAWGQGASEYWLERARRESLMARWGTSEDVADVATFLCSQSARFISGQIIPVNGGFRFSPES